MAYPDLPPGATFWRCAQCDNETLFRAAGTGHIECERCAREWTLEQLKDAHAHARAHGESPSAH